VTASEIEEVDFSPLLRAADETPPDGVDGVLARRQQVLERLRSLP
jgi:V/A-type H+-transporting ATPase subunit A